MLFVLVHGTGHGGFAWKKVAPILRAAGADVYTPTLTGLADRSHLLDRDIDLTTHITDIASLLFYEDLSDVVLVGHSYSGMVITGVAATIPERLRLLVYLDAYVPDEGQTEVDLWPPDMRADIEATAGDGGATRAPPPPELMGITDPALAKWVSERTTPHPMATYTEAPPPGNALSRAIPRAFIQCTEGPLTEVFGTFAQKARGNGWIVREIATGHDAMLTAPDAVAATLLDLAGA